MEKNVKKLGLEHMLYGRDNIRGNSSRKYPTSIEKWYTYFDEYKRHGVDRNVYRTFSIRYYYGWYLIQTRRFKLAYEVMNQCLDSLKQLIQTDKKYNCYLSGVLKGIDEAKRLLH